ncbi:MAG: helix-turn-helix transcriptional regulator [Ktedonobacterales bacterium]|nr:helix-turn-helix transcriptional regulator [Ktedonobacterales bacterium]
MRANDQADTAETAGADDRWARGWGHLLRVARQVAGLSLTELSTRTGLSKGYLSKLESGYASARNPSRATLAALGRALPSFRPLAHTLEPATPLGALALADAAPLPPLAAPAEQPLGEDHPAAPAPIQLGWRELELLVALLALEQSAAPLPLTALTLARATGRTRDHITPTLERLLSMGVIERMPPTRVGGAPSYRRAPGAMAHAGLSRLGDVLVLAGALLSQAPIQPRRRHQDREP